MDPLLRRSLGDTRRTGPDPCPDADLLSAFLEGALSEDERRGVASHAADCGRCSQIIALTAETAPAAEHPLPQPHRQAPDAVKNPWRHAYWTVPLATAATVAGLWIASPREAVAPTQTIVTSAPQSDGAPRFHDAVEPQRSAPAAPPAVESQAGTVQGGQAANTPQELRMRAADDALRAEPPQDQRTTTGASVGAADEARELARQAQSPAPPAAAAPAAASRAEESAATLRRVDPLAGRAGVAVSFLAPGGQVRWRVSGPSIERSIDGGATWATEYSASRPVTTGVAIDADVAWAGGEQGLVLRRTAGGWAAVSPPLADRIVTIRATSATEAAITAAGGQTLRTTDAGASWR